MEGWIRIHRKLLETSFSKKPTIGWLFICLLLKANHKENKFLFNNKEITIKEGQLLTGRDELSKNTGLSVMQVRYALYSLKVTNTITIKTTNKFSVITICKWKQYQNFNQQSNQPVTNKQPASNQQITTNNNDNNDKNVNNVKKIESITEETIKTVCEDYQVPREFVLSKIDDIKNYCASTGKVYKDYVATLRHWVKKDALQIQKEVSRYESKRGIDARSIE